MAVSLFGCSHLNLPSAQSIQKREESMKARRLRSAILSMRNPEEFFLCAQRLTKALCGDLLLNVDFTQAIVAKTFPYMFWMKLHNKSDVDNRWGDWDSFPSGKIPKGHTVVFPDVKVRMCRDRRKTLLLTDKGWDGLRGLQDGPPTETYWSVTLTPSCYSFPISNVKS